MGSDSSWQRKVGGAFQVWNSGHTGTEGRGAWCHVWEMQTVWDV